MILVKMLIKLTNKENMYFKKVNFIFVSLLVVMSAWSMNDKCEVTKQLILRHKDEYFSYVLSMQKKVKYTPSCLIKIGAVAKKYDTRSISYIPISYRFFGYSKYKIIQKLKRVICDNPKEEDLKYINDGINNHNKQGKNDKNELSHILHIKHVKSLDLPKGVNEQAVINNPELLVDFINKGKIDSDEYDHRMALNLFIQFWQERVKKRI